MRECKCGHVGPASEFVKGRKDCKGCEKIRVAKYYQANKEKIAADNAAYHKANKEKINASKAAYYKANKEKIAAYRQANKEKIVARSTAYHKSNREEINAKVAAWSKSNPDKINTNAANRRASKLQRTPDWLTPDDQLWIAWHYRHAKAMEEHTGIPHHVDHIHPMQGTIVSGLHVPINLQVIPASENLSKYNRLED